MSLRLNCAIRGGNKVAYDVITLWLALTFSIRLFSF